MYVVKRDGRNESFQFEKITSRIKKLSYGLSIEHLDSELVAQKVTGKIYNGITTTQIDKLAAETAAAMTTDHPTYSSLAARIVVSDLHKNTNKSFSQTIKAMYNHVTEGSGLVAHDVYEIIMKNAELLDSEIIDDRDFEFEYFGFKILERSCLLKVQGKVVERPQHMLMRVAVGIHKDDIDSAIRTYHMMSQHWFTLAFPTLFNAGTPSPQLSNCSLVCMEEDSINRTHACKCVFYVYLEPWHSDIFEFLDLRRNHGKEEHQGHNRFGALWVPDLFMTRVENNEQWSLFCPKEVPGLADCWGVKFQELYMQYEREGKAKKVVSAQHLWYKIVKVQLETGTPSVLFKDTCNRKSNQPHFGNIKPSETAICSSASITLPRFVREKGIPIESQPSKLVGSRGSKNRYFDFDKLAEVTSFITTNLNKVIDVNYYPVDTAKKSILRLRRIGIGFEGLADTFILLGIPFDSPEARQLNKDICETIYYHALKASSDLAAIEGPYERYQGSPVSKGILQIDTWGVTPSDRWDWAALRQMISRNGIRNYLLVAPMPTASTSQILGNNECFEPYTSFIYREEKFSCEFIANKHLHHDLSEMGLWSSALKKKIISDGGSVRKISEIPGDLKAIYKNVLEIKPKTLVDMATDRGCYVDQIQILNVHLYRPNFCILTAFHFYAWYKGLKTGVFI